LFDESGGLKKPETRKFVEAFLVAFAAWVEQTAAKPSA